MGLDNIYYLNLQSLGTCVKLSVLGCDVTTSNFSYCMSTCIYTLLQCCSDKCIDMSIVLVFCECFCVGAARTACSEVGVRGLRMSM